MVGTVRDCSRSISRLDVGRTRSFGNIGNGNIRSDMEGVSSIKYDEDVLGWWDN